MLTTFSARNIFCMSTCSIILYVLYFIFTPTLSKIIYSTYFPIFTLEWTAKITSDRWPCTRRVALSSPFLPRQPPLESRGESRGLRLYDNGLVRDLMLDGEMYMRAVRMNISPWNGGRRKARNQGWWRGERAAFEWPIIPAHETDSLRRRATPGVDNEGQRW